MKSRHLIYPLVITLAVGVPVARYYTVTPGYNACVLEYVDALEENDFKGNIYDIKGERHIESVEGDYDALEEFKIGKSYGCIMVSNDAYADLSNTFYCSVAYMLEKSPLRNQKAAEAREEGVTQGADKLESKSAR